MLCYQSTSQQPYKRTSKTASNYNAIKGYAPLVRGWRGINRIKDFHAQDYSSFLRKKGIGRLPGYHSQNKELNVGGGL